MGSVFDNPLFDVPTILLPSHSFHRINISLNNHSLSGVKRVVDCKVKVKVGACGIFPVYDTALVV